MEESGGTLAFRIDSVLTDKAAHRVMAVLNTRFDFLVLFSTIAHHDVK